MIVFLVAVFLLLVHVECDSDFVRLRAAHESVSTSDLCLCVRARVTCCAGFRCGLLCVVPGVGRVVLCCVTICAAKWRPPSELRSFLVLLRLALIVRAPEARSHDHRRSTKAHALRRLAVHCLGPSPNSPQLLQGYVRLQQQPSWPSGTWRKARPAAATTFPLASSRGAACSLW